MALKESFAAASARLDEINQLFESIDIATAFLSEGKPITALRAQARHNYIQPLWQQCRLIHTELLQEPETLRSKHPCNTLELINDIPALNHGHALDRVIQADDTIKILGLVWSPLSDTYRPSVNCLPLEVVSKRAVLSAIARLYDPLGWLSPVVITAKILMQRLWKLSLDWDEELPASLKEEWMSYYHSLPSLNMIALPRWTKQGSDIVSSELHGFSDASTKAYAAVVYLRTVSITGEVQISLLMSKTKVAPIKELTVPRLELQAAVLLARTLCCLRSIPELRCAPIHCWVDSSIVLAWLRKQSSTWKTFIANRVSEIHTSLRDAQWRHVAGVENPADLASRGVDPAMFVECHSWFHGPSWLMQAPANWPDSLPSEPDSAVLEQRVVSCSCSPGSSTLDYTVRLSSWNKLLRVTAWLLKWLPTNKHNNRSSIDATEVRLAQLRIVRLLQAQQFASEIMSLQKGHSLSKRIPLIGLNPFLDSDDILRVGERLSDLLIPTDTKHPMILQNHRISKLIIIDAHERCLHGGVSLTLSTLRTKFWVLQAKKLIRSVIFHCVRCARVKAELGQQLMGSLPSSRTTRPNRAFEHTGVDYAGPVSVRIASGRGHKSHPAYLALFVCMATKAIHIEVVSDYTAASFLAAYHRFCSRRGTPTNMYSDHGTNFQGADRELQQAFASAKANPNFQGRLAKDSVTWKYIPPAAPHFGGLWEAGVKSVKSHLRRILVSRTPTFEELTTLTSRIEACLNSGLLAPLTDDPESLDTLTPAHFLVGVPLTTIPEPSLLDTSTSRLSRWQAINQAAQLFWKRWSHDYVLSLQHRSKWRTRQESIRVGQLVLLSAPNLPPTQWRLGRVTELLPGHIYIYDTPTGKFQTFRRWHDVGKVVSTSLINIGPILALTLACYARQRCFTTLSLCCIPTFFQPRFMRLVSMFFANVVSTLFASFRPTLYCL